MRIYKDPTPVFKYVFDFEYSENLVSYCRVLKSKVGSNQLNFADKKWRFNDLNLVTVITKELDGVAVDVNMMEDLEAFALEKAQLKMRLEKIEKLKTATDSDINVVGIKGELYPYQKVGVEFFMSNDGRAILADDMGCLSGDTEIIVNRGGCARRYTLEQVYLRTKVYFQKWSQNIVSYTRSYDEENKEFALNEIKDIILVGEKETIEITAVAEEKEYKIRLTPDHKMINDKGEWVEAQTLSIGDKVLVNGKKVKYCPVCGEETEHVSYPYAKFKEACKVCVYKDKRQNGVSPSANKADFHFRFGFFTDKDGYVRVKSGVSRHPNWKKQALYLHILAMEAKLNGLTTTKWLNRIKKNDFRENDVFIDSKVFAVHHIDGDKNNNSQTNLAKMTHAEHARIEAIETKYLHFRETFLPRVAVVTSIKKGKKEEVYDIVMADPHRNFIANGFVVHNCGKSIQTLAYITTTKLKKTLIVSPAAVKYVWEKEVTKWTKLSPVVVESSTDFDTSLYSKHDVFIINYDILKKFHSELLAYQWDIMCCDEFHYIKNSSAQRTKIVKLIARRIPRLLLLSGTPLLSRPVELFNGLNLMDPVKWGDYYSFTKRYCDGKQGYWGGWEAKGATNIEELQTRISRYFLRRRKEDVLLELPSKTLVDVPVQLSKEARKEYEEAMDDFARYLKEKGRDTQATTLVKLSELRQITTRGKYKTALEMVKDTIDSGKKIVVFSVYNEPLEMLKQELGDMAVILTGKSKEEERRSAVDSFQENPDINVFLGGMKSAGAGITLTAASVVLFIDYSWVPADHEQARDRAHRIGQKENVTVYQLYARDTIDSFMQELLEKKKEIFNKLVEEAPDREAVKENIINDLLTLIKKRKIT